MTDKYNPAEIEAKWKQKWHEAGLDKAEIDQEKAKYYTLVMFPYPSGEGLHVGHWRPYVISDVWTRYQLMMGKEVLYPMGWDAFGLPAENRAIKQGIHPAESNKQAIPNMKRQLMETGALFDWSREVDTASPEYYKWTQWIFLQFYKMGLAYRKEAQVNWCPKDQTVLANEQVVNGECERCGTEVTKKSLKQWFFKITQYAEELLKFDAIRWPERVKIMQKNWIGKSEGAELSFKVQNSEAVIEVFTTRPDTVLGTTFLVLAPEHPLVEKITTSKQKVSVTEYQEAAKRKTEIERTSTDKKKTGVFTGAYAINPATNKPIPIWIADYVLSTYGTGAIMAVPAHDERDYAFAKQYELPVEQVIETKGELPATEKGTIIIEGKYRGRHSDEILDELITEIRGNKKTIYRLRDWLVSRQRYWGAPIPIVYCEKCGEVPVPEDQLPVELPYLVDFQPQGESPLARDAEFVNTTCPNCGGKAKRETDTMDTFVDSSWYFLRFCDPNNRAIIFDPEKVKYWMPVDLYIGGVEHAILHLLYARFITKVLADQGLFSFREPFKQLLDNGMIYLHGKKMSKSKGNVINPDELVTRYGADTLRGYEMFIGPATDDVEWNPNGVAGVYRFLHKAWDIMHKPSENGELQPITHKLVKKVSNDIDRFSFNTVVSSLMSYINEAATVKLTTQDKMVFVQLLAPVFPFIAEELWQGLGNSESVFYSSWPTFDEAKITDDTVTIVVQVNGKTKGTLTAPKEAAEAQVRSLVTTDSRLAQIIGSKVERVVYIPGRLINFVLK